MQRIWEWIWTQRNIQRQWSDITDLIVAKISRFEKLYSRFDTNSLVSQLNTHRVLDRSHYTIEYEHILALCQYFYDISWWYFDIRVWSDLESRWYDASYSFKAKKTEHIISLLTITATQIVLTGTQTIDLWWIGKWYLIMLLAKICRDQHITSYHINWWWDILTVWDRWSIWLQHPHDDAMIVGTINWDGAYASSGAYHRRRWDYHHLVDPIAHTPAVNKASVHVYHPYDCMIADVASTVIYVAPLDIGMSFAQHVWVEYIIIYDDLTSTRSAWYPFIA